MCIPRYIFIKRYNLRIYIGVVRKTELNLIMYNNHRSIIYIVHDVAYMNILIAFNIHDSSHRKQNRLLTIVLCPSAETKKNLVLFDFHKRSIANMRSWNRNFRHQNLFLRLEKFIQKVDIALVRALR